jgi:cystathionine gamma-lyase / homocysteine desulfhydrase
MDKITQSLHYRIDDSQAHPVVTPIYQASAFQANSPFFYTRKNNPNIEELETVIATLEEAEHCVATTTGMSAIAIVLNLLAPHDTLVVNKDIYGCSYKLLQKYTDRLQIRLLTLDLSEAAGIEQLPAETSMVLFETPTNPFLKTIDIQAVSRKVKSRNPGALVVVDNTWATPLFQQPLRWGADISLHSATKYFSGHSDVMGGCMLTNSSEVAELLREQRFYYGAILEPHSAWLLRRSLQTLDLRMRQHQDTTLQMREFLETLPEVTRVYYPVVDGRQLTGYGTLLFFDLRGDLVPHYPVLARTLKLFDTGTGMACVTSMIAQPFTGSHASMTDEEKGEMGLNRGLIRLSFGLEKIEDLKQDLRNAFAALPIPALPQEVVE